MNKKYLWYILTFIMVSIFTIGVSSCGGDGDNEEGYNGENGKVSIVGRWVDGSTTMTLGKDGSYNLTNTSIPGITQYRTGTYFYNSNQSLLSVNVVAVEGQNSAYQQTYIVETLTESTLVLLYLDGDVEGYYTRK